MAREDRCDACRFWLPDRQPKLEIVTQGECRRYPPTLAYGGYGGDDPDVIEHSTYPATFDDEWCGEFRPQSSAEPSISLNAANVLRVLFESNGAETRRLVVARAAGPHSKRRPDMDGGNIDTTGASVADQLDVDAADTDTGTTERDFDAEARAHGWTPKDDFKGDAAKWVDAETFVKRADEVMPFLKKQNAGLKRQIDDLTRQFKKASEHFGKAEERAYKRALTELQAKHNAAVEEGDVAGANKVLKDMDELKADAAPKIDRDDAPDPKQAAREFAEWVEDNDWYVSDDKKRAYADIQAGAMGPAGEWDGGPKAWLDELGKRVSRKFAEQKPNLANPGGNRGNGGPRGAKTFADLPPNAKAMCDKWVKQGLIKTREDYVKAYDWS
jgi:hypothetical protein